MTEAQLAVSALFDLACTHITKLAPLLHISTFSDPERSELLHQIDSARRAMEKIEGDIINQRAHEANRDEQHSSPPCGR